MMNNNLIFVQIVVNIKEFRIIYFANNVIFLQNHKNNIMMKILLIF